MLKLGIVGLPNVGKSTLFKALTNKQVDIQNYPFTTIDPNVGVVAVPDERLKPLAELSNSKKIINTTIEFYDIAGLVKGASQGKGLGNKFLANIREVDAIAHVVRVFEDPAPSFSADHQQKGQAWGGASITHIYNRVNPVDDIEIIKTEVEFADLQTKSRRLEKSGPRPKASGEKIELPALDLLADKKVIFVLNVSESQMSEGWQPGPDLLKAMAGRDYVVLSTPLELIMSGATEDEKKEYLVGFNMKDSGLDRLIKQSYKTLGLVTFLTTGEDETRAWTAHEGDLIPKASRVIHTDFERLFIRAEVINWKTLLETGGLVQARSKGLIKTVGRDYIIQEGDVVEILIGK